MSISTENRNDSFKQINTKKRAEEVLAAFEEGERLTAREALHKLKPNSDDLNYVRPRITELCASGYLEEAGTVFDVYSRRTVTAWKRTDSVQQQMF